MGHYIIRVIGLKATIAFLVKMNLDTSSFHSYNWLDGDDVARFPEGFDATLVYTIARNRR